MDATDDGDRLPDDVLVDILGRLPCHALAESRRFCRSWRAAVDGNSFLLPYFLPGTGTFSGVFTNIFWSKDDDEFCYSSSKRYASRLGTAHGAKSSFFSPWTSRSGRHRGAGGEPFFRFPSLRHDWATVLDHCNGLLLLLHDGDLTWVHLRQITTCATRRRHGALGCPVRPSSRRGHGRTTRPCSSPSTQPSRGTTRCSSSPKTTPKTRSDSTFLNYSEKNKYTNNDSGGTGVPTKLAGSPTCTVYINH
jgi:hypothetical protein